MATSGTTAFNLDLTELVEEAFERCGSEVRSGYDLRTARRSLNIMFSDWANRGVNLWTVVNHSIPLLTGVQSYNLDPNNNSNITGGIVDIMDAVIRTNQSPITSTTDLTISRIALPTYMSIPNKYAQARPIQFYVERVSPVPKIYVWPVPNTNEYTFYYSALRRVQDAGSGSDTMDVPFRFIPCMVAGLAYYLSMKIAGGLERMQALKMQYDEAWDLASSEDRDKSPVRFVPRQQFIS